MIDKEGDKVGCKCGGQYIPVNGILICPECGKHSPYQPKPTYQELLEENSKLKEVIKDLQSKPHQTAQNQ